MGAAAGAVPTTITCEVLMENIEAPAALLLEARAVHLSPLINPVRVASFTPEGITTV
jgi:hypothetical protein